MREGVCDWKRERGERECNRLNSTAKRKSVKKSLVKQKLVVEEKLWRFYGFLIGQKTCVALYRYYTHNAYYYRKSSTCNNISHCFAAGQYAIYVHACNWKNDDYRKGENQLCHYYIKYSRILQYVYNYSMKFDPLLSAEIIDKRVCVSLHIKLCIFLWYFFTLFWLLCQSLDE